MKTLSLDSFLPISTTVNLGVASPMMESPSKKCTVGGTRGFQGPIFQYLYSKRSNRNCDTNGVGSHTPSLSESPQKRCLFPLMQVPAPTLRLYDSEGPTVVFWLLSSLMSASPPSDVFLTNSPVGAACFHEFQMT